MFRLFSCFSVSLAWSRSGFYSITFTLIDANFSSASARAVPVKSQQLFWYLFWLNATPAVLNAAANLKGSKDFFFFPQKLCLTLCVSLAVNSRAMEFDICSKSCDGSARCSQAWLTAGGRGGGCLPGGRLMNWLVGLVLGTPAPELVSRWGSWWLLVMVCFSWIPAITRLTFQQTSELTLRFVLFLLIKVPTLAC